MIKILLTGITGMLGSAIALSWKEKFQLFGIISTYKIYNYDNNIQYLTFNLASDNYLKLKNFCNPDVIINCAAITDMSICEIKQEYAYKVNALAVKKIANTFPNSYIIHISTDAVFGRNIIFPNEDVVPEPISIYGKTKLYGEKLLLEYSNSALVLRTTIVGFGGYRQNRSLAEWILSSLDSNQTIKLYKDALFMPISVWDFINILEWCITNRPLGILHAAGSERISKFDFGYSLACMSKHNDKLLIPSFIAGSQYSAIRRFDQSISSKKIEQLRGIPLPSGLSCVTSILKNRSTS